MPEVQDMRTDPRARNEGLEAARALPPGHLAELCEAQKQEAEKATSRLREDWQRYWDLWQNDVSFEGKEEWQSQIWVAKPFASVEQGGALIQRSLLDSPEFFGVTGDDKRDRINAVHVVKPLVRKLLDEAGYIPKFSDCSKVGLMLGVAGYKKFRWATSRIPQLSGVQIDPETGAIMPSFRYKNASMLAIDYVLPWRIFRDPDTQPRENFSGTYLWHCEWRGRPALQAMVDHGWNKEALDRVLASNQSAENSRSLTNSQRLEAERKHESWERHKFRKDYAIDEGWLDILDANGDVVLPDGLMVHCNREIVYGPVENPLWATDLQTGRRKSPFTAGAPIGHPTRFEGRGILEADEGLALMYSNTLNLTADGMNWVVNPDSELYQPGLVNWDDTADYPGKLWLKNVKEQIINRSQRGEIPLDKAMAFLQFLDQNRENTNFVTAFVAGLPGYRSEITKGETEIKTAQGMGMFDAIARNLEDVGRVDTELAWNFGLQYLGGNDYADPSLARILGPERASLIRAMPLVERINQLQGNYNFTFTSVSQALQKSDQLKRVMQAATLAASGPYVGLTNPAQVLRFLFELLGVMDRIDVREPAPPMMGGPGMMAPPGMMPPSVRQPMVRPGMMPMRRPQGALVG